MKTKPDTMIDYLAKLVGFYSTSDNQAAVKELLQYVGAHLAINGFYTTLHEYDGHFSLYASINDTLHSHILLQGHIDVVPGKQPFAIKGDRCFGRGTYDMLFSTAAFMRLADELAGTGALEDVAIMLTGDEEKGGFLGVNRLLGDAGYTADVCILPDAGEGFGSLNSAAKGVFDPTIRINGRSHHGSRPWEGDGAAVKLVRFLHDAEQLFDSSDRHNSTMTIARLTAGTAMNQGPASAEVSLDIRYKDTDDLARIETGFAALLQQYQGEITAITGGSSYQLDTDAPLVKQFITLYEKHAGKPIVMTKAHGSSDARFFSEKGIPVIMLRPDGGGAHGDNEWLSIPSFEQFYDLLKDYVTTVASKV